MQERGVRRIDADLERLQPVAVDVALEGEGVAIRRDETVELGKCRRLAFAEPGPQDAALFHHRISALDDVLAQPRILRLGRGFEALARDVEQPAVEGAAQAAVFQPPEGKVGAAMRAMPLDQAVAALLIAKQHEVLAEQFDRFYRTRALHLVDQRRRLPVHSHQLAARILRTRPGDEVVRFLAHHGGSPFVRLLNEWANYDMNW